MYVEWCLAALYKYARAWEVGIYGLLVSDFEISVKFEIVLNRIADQAVLTKCVLTERRAPGCAATRNKLCGL
jgi:hypothetical protein